MSTTHTTTTTAATPVRRTYEHAPRRCIGRCKSCKRGMLVTTVAHVTYYAAGGGGWVVKTAEMTDDGRELADNPALVARCSCGGWVRLTPVRGKYSAAHVCNARCESATGFDCECSCAGKNHGAAHAA